MSDRPGLGAWLPATIIVLFIWIVVSPQCARSQGCEGLRVCGDFSQCVCDTCSTQLYCHAMGGLLNQHEYVSCRAARCHAGQPEASYRWALELWDARQQVWWEQIHPLLSAAGLRVPRRVPPRGP